MKGKFIVLEGGDGAGKDAQINLLRKELVEKEFLFVHDPGGTHIGTKLREIVLHDKSVARWAELLIYLAARVQMVEELIKPALKTGKHVISNRFDLSTIAYQIYGRQRLDILEFVKEMSEYALGGTKPDLLIFLDCPPKIGLQRIKDSGTTLDRFEKEKLAFHERVYEGYKKHVTDYNHIIVDATCPIRDVYTDVLKAVQELVKE